MIRVACLGAGYFSQFHRDGWDRIDGATCVGVADLDLDRARATDLPAFGTLAAMLDATRPDVLDVILPSDAQAEAIQTALNAGVQTIICQKPFAQSYATAKQVTQAAEQAGAALIVHENFRFQPWYRRAKALIDEGAIGTVLQGSFRFRPGDGQGPDAYLARQPYFQTMPRFLIHETGVHWVDTFRFLFGDPRAVYADLARMNPAIAGEDTGTVLFDHPGGIRTLLDGNRLLDHAASNTRCTMGEGVFEGTTGTLTLIGDGSLHLRHHGHLTSVEVLGPDTSGRFGGDCTRHLQAHVIDALQGGGVFENTARDYLRVIEIEEAIYRSAQTGQKQRLGASNG